MKVLLIGVLTFFVFGGSQVRAEFMVCWGGNVYEGDSQAEVGMKCGRPLRVMRAQPRWIVESQGEYRSSGRWEIRELFIYPNAGSSFPLYYLFFTDYQLISIKSGSYGTIPK
jgi:hypothetical protein